MEELRARHASGLNGPLEVAGTLIELDTTAAPASELAHGVVRQLA